MMVPVEAHKIIQELKVMRVDWLGSSDYEATLQKQLDAADRVRLVGLPCLLACEHPAVITLGKRGQPLSDVLASMDLLRQQQIKIVATDRGGQATLHNEGQLVIYPVMPLRRWRFGVRDYVECLERATAHYLAEYGLEVTRGFEPGLFFKWKKNCCLWNQGRSGRQSPRPRHQFK